MDAEQWDEILEVEMTPEELWRFTLVTWRGGDWEDFLAAEEERRGKQVRSEHEEER